MTSEITNKCKGIFDLETCLYCPIWFCCTLLTPEDTQILREKQPVDEDEKYEF